MEIQSDLQRMGGDCPGDKGPTWVLAPRKVVGMTTERITAKLVDGRLHYWNEVIEIAMGRSHCKKITQVINTSILVVDGLGEYLHLQSNWN